MSSPHARNQDKPLYLSIGNEAFRLLLTELLGEWGFTLCTTYNPDAGCVVLVDEVGVVPPGVGNPVLMSHSAFGGRDRLRLPLVLEELWCLLETRFHRPPRNHLRIALDYPVSVHVRGEKAPAQIISLSAVGARLPLHRELAFGEEFAIILPLPEHVLHLHAKVIYVTPLGEHNGRYEAGVLFPRIDPATRQILRDHIVAEYLRRIKPRIPGWAFEIGISYLDLPVAVLDHL